MFQAHFRGKLARQKVGLVGWTGEGRGLGISCGGSAHAVGAPGPQATAAEEEEEKKKKS